MTDFQLNRVLALAEKLSAFELEEAIEELNQILGQKIEEEE